MKKIVLYISLAFLVTACQSPKSESVEGKVFVEAVKNNTDAQIVDVRTPQEFAQGHVLKAINIDANNPNWKSELSKLDKNKPVYLYCLSGARSSDMMKALHEEGYKEVYNLDGGLAKLDQALVAEVVDKSSLKQKPSSNVEGMTIDQFDKYIAEHKNVVVDFYADWCGPCKMMDPHIKKIAEENKDKFTLLKVNFDGSKELAQKFKIRGIPHVMIYKNGELVDRQEGFHPQMVEEFKAKILKPFNS